MGWSLTHVWQLKIRRDISAVEIPLEEKGVPDLHQAPQLRYLVLGREVPITSGCENHWRLWLEMENCWSPGVLLKGLTCGLTGSQTHLL